MRLICPNCGAQYEVPPEAIPAQGRDVQCSACGRTWFEGGPEAPEPATPAQEAPARALPDPAEEAPGAARDAGDLEEEDDLADLDLGPEEDEAPPPAARPRPSVSPEVAEILRAEARREAEAREREARGERPEPPHPPPAETPAETPALTPAETPPEPAHLALERERQRAEEARRRMARLKGQDAPLPGAVVPPAPATRRDRLPDIEEINSSLRAGPSGEAAAPRPPAGRRGFRLGFGGVLLVAAALALLYVYGPRLAAALPWAGAVLDPYVAAVDEGRLWLDLRLQDLLRSLGGAAAAGLPEPPPLDEAPAVQTEPPAAPAPAE